MSSNPIFTPVQGSEAQIRNAVVQNGSLYFATDSGKMYLDTPNGRISVGGGGGSSEGAALYYGTATKPVEDENGQFYSIEVEQVNGYPKTGDLILNSDGGFYKVESATQTHYICTLLTISGGTTVAPVETRVPSLLLEDFYDVNIINGSSVGVWFTATSANNANGNPLAKSLTITWKLFDGDAKSGTLYKTSSFSVPSGERFYFEFGSHLRDSTTSTLQLVATGINHKGSSDTGEITVSTTKLTLELDPDFSNTAPFDPDRVIFLVNAAGNISKKMEVRFDGEIVKTANMDANQEWNEDIAIDPSKCTHGYHTIRVDLYPIINGVQGKPINPIEFEIAVVEPGVETPIVWLGNYQKVYYTYDSIQIPYLAYDPTSPSSASVYLYKNYKQYDGVREITSRAKFAIWEISDADNEATNYYQIASGNNSDKRRDSQREIEFQVLQDSRDLTVAAKNYLRLNFDPKGKSNSESPASREKWSYTNKSGEVIHASFDKFNWTNNGWEMDEKNNTFLRISNGAKFAIPIGRTSFSEQSHTFELMFKIKNVQNYGSLVKNVTRYYLDDSKKETDATLYNEFVNQTDFDNYDAFLQWKLGADYDKLFFREVQKVLNMDNAVCKYCDGSGQNVIGWALGAQDAFFRDGQKAVSVSYVDEDLVSLSIVYKYDTSGKNMIQFYLNGVITGADYTTATAFTLGAQNPYIEFNTDFCDIDLYKLRVYNTNLDVNEIVKNYCVDRKDINNFDLINLAKKNSNTGEYQIQFDRVEQWNKDHPNNQTMPYIIFDTTNDPMSKDADGKMRLPWSKSTPMKTTVTFVNTQLDQAYASGELEELAGPKGDKLWNEKSTVKEKEEAVKLYYKHHCPSWTGDNCELVVQGTSSEYYPRRNYKIKTKTEYDTDEVERIHIFLNNGPYLEQYKDDPESTRQSYWYMNNYTNGTHKWTMKVDYMESSGSYNAGFASMVGTAYSKHPLKDYLDNGALSTTIQNGEGKDYNGLTPANVKFTDQAVDLTSNSNIRWQDYRTSLLGFPVMAFHKRGEKDYVFIGYYRMLLDKGSDEVLGFKPPKNVKANFLGGKDMRKKAECWEFSNNNRTYCSYRDPEDRVELSFMPSDEQIANEKGLTAAGVPIVADCFEYRYNDNEDYLDILYNLGKKDSASGQWSFAGKEKDAKDFLDETKIDITSVDNWPAARKQMIKYYSNWEKVCQWIWSTCLDNVVSMGSYVKAQVGNIPFVTDGTLYKENGEGGFTQITSGTFEESIPYYQPEVIINEETGEEVTKWNKVYVYNSEENKYAANKFYQNIDSVYSLVDAISFNPDIQYYKLVVDDSYKTKSDLLVAPATEWVEGTEYYTWDKTKTTASVRAGSPSVTSVGKIDKETFDNGTYYVAAPVTYGAGEGAKTYYYDTQEYRAEKFVKELSSHFDLEYLATYFIMTEVFECYDSRGKNCMMASWGPLKDGGEYIWYPIFYDIDTQLGINNTGIPSFEFNVDVTLQDNFSTSDSILWNNFYSFFRGSYILQKYKHLKGEESIIFDKKLADPPLKSISKVESWYLFNPEETKNIAAKGLRPLIATNLDSWYKYITTTNIVGASNKNLLGDVGYLGRNGEWLIDTDGKFYMLQGDRSQSRQSFLTKRIDYVDSWLGVGGYARSGSNCIWGRVSANDLTDTSDKWIEGVNGEQYWKDALETEKTHEFDAQYWLDLTPLYSTYVTVSDDSAAYPPVKYDGINKAKIYSSAIESGVRKSKNYREQLLYIYGSDKMLDIGDMSNLYWREFRIDGSASKLTRLKLGHDGTSYDYIIDETGKKVYSELPWKNGFMNKPNFPSGIGSSGMPLLKEVNLCNITIKANGSDPTFDFSTCYKLENFRATGSNIAQVDFAKGVALNTLYMPATTKSLSLVEANMLTSVLKEYTPPVKNEVTNALQAIPGLYLESFFEENPSSQLNQLNLKNGKLGYGSFDLFTRLYNLRKGQSGNRLSLIGIDWCPYVQVSKGEKYDRLVKYVYDNGHYGFDDYTYIDDTAFNAAITRGELYKENTPYIKVKSTDVYNSALSYYIYDNENYTAYSYTSTEDFLEKANTNTLYYKDMSIVNRANDITITTYNQLKSLINDPNFKSFENPDIHSTFSGIIYISNDEASEVDEYELSDTMTKAYPDLKIFMKKVKSAYSAQFVVLNDDGSYKYVPDSKGDITYKSIQKISQADFALGKKTFQNPFTSYDPTQSKDHHTFIGWTTSLNPDMKNYSNVLLTNESDKWGTEYKGIKWGIIAEGENNQLYYAVYTRRIYHATFIDRENPSYIAYCEVQYDPDGSYFNDNVKEPICVKPVEDMETRYTLKGWTATENYGGSYPAGVDISEYLVDVSKYLAISDTLKFYAVFQNESVYDSITDNKYFIYTYDKGYPVINLNPELGDNLQGKITLPARDPKGKMILGLGLFASYFADGVTAGLPKNPTGQNITHIFFERGSAYKYIEDYAFINHSTISDTAKLKVIALPNTIEKIGARSFQYRYNTIDTIWGITHTPINNNITSIGAYAFAGATTVQNTIPIPMLSNALTTLGANAFENNDGIEITEIPANIVEIPSKCFIKCPNININTFGDDNSKLTTIGDQAFRNAGKNKGPIDNLYLGRKVVTLGSKAFNPYGSDSGIKAVYTPNRAEDVSWADDLADIFGSYDVIVNYETDI